MENNEFNEFDAKKSVDELIDTVKLHITSQVILDKERYEALKKHLLSRELTSEQKQLIESYISTDSEKVKNEILKQETGTNDIQNRDKGPTGIGGWLILVVIGLVVSIFRLGFDIFNEFIPLINTIDTLPNFSGVKHLVYFELIINSIFVLYAIALLFLMFNYSRYFPRLMIIYLSSNLLFIIADLIIVSQIPTLSQYTFNESTYKELFRGIVGIAIWVPYMFISKRVKNTFVQ